MLPRTPTHTAGAAQPGTPSQRARTLLHVSAVPAVLPCRDDAHATIYATIADSLERGQGTCLYVSGVPGTGKTATVRAVLAQLQAQMAAGEVAPFECVQLNCMKMSEPAQAYARLWEGLSGERASPAAARDLLNARFTAPPPNALPCVVVMDELDILMSKMHVVYNFFSWPDLPAAQLVVVAIANTMDLPERLAVNKISSRIGASSLCCFPPFYAA